ncbi:MAG: type II toxin-antitoxin system RelE/ParE family toxin [Boseongicola sp.]|nr:type II toxin-antitoxin system RelE/ParE family toxin [Boseongicola sp.]
MNANDLTRRKTLRYENRATRSFADKRTAAIFKGHAVRCCPTQIQGRARDTLPALDAAEMIDDLRFPPGNRLKAMRGGRTGQHSLRVDDQWRICLVWRDGDAWDVEIVDYHQGSMEHDDHA